MRTIDWLQLALFVAALALITKPMGLYLMQVLDANGRTWLDPILKPLERVTYRVMGTQIRTRSRIGDSTRLPCCCSAW
jgi:K+-transporting ATPase ATPase A chain